MDGEHEERRALRSHGGREQAVRRTPAGGSTEPGQTLGAGTRGSPMPARRVAESIAASPFSTPEVPMHRLALVLASVLAGLLVAVFPASAQAPPPRSPRALGARAGRARHVPRHGHPVHEGEPIGLAWDLDGDRAFDDATGDTASRSFDAGEHVVRLRAARARGTDDRREDDRRGRTDRTVAEPHPIRPRPPEPTPAPPQPRADTNQPPVAAFDKDCSKTGAFVLCAGLFAREQKPHTIDASPSHDPDGSIVRYEWDLDGTGGFERDTGAARPSRTRSSATRASSTAQAARARARDRRRRRDRRGRADAHAARARLRAVVTRGASAPRPVPAAPRPRSTARRSSAGTPSGR